MNAFEPDTDEVPTATRAMPDLEGVRHEYVETNGIRMHVAAAGEGDPVLLLHGWPQNWWQWHKVMPALAAEHRILAADLRGLGWTDAPPWGYNPRTQADDVIGLLDALGIQRCAVIGTDWGGAVGYLLALRHPDRVTRFMVLNTANVFWRPTLRRFASVLRLWHIAVNAMPLLGPRLMRHAMPRWALRHWSRETGLLDPEDQEIFLAQFREEDRVRAAVRYYRDLLCREIPLIVAGQYTWGRLTVPTLILSGDSDPILPPRQMAAPTGWEANIEMELLNDIGHFPSLETPDRLIQRALRFLATDERDDQRSVGPPSADSTR